ncbi:MAG: transposase [Prevotellaceae bacterium]|jgi:IS605 OrfB family transposase|nr:transposase [Prevotellaceae bacterium]
MFTIKKTICVKIFEPTKIKERLLGDILTISGNLSRFYVNEMESLGTSNKAIVHKETYTKVKCTYPEFPTGLIQTIRDKSIETYKSYKALIKKSKKATLPQFTNPVVRYDCRTFTLYKSENSFEYFVSLSTPKGRVRLPIQFGSFQLNILNGLSDKSLKFCTAELKFSKRLKHYILNITYEYEVEETTTSNVCGIDLGLINYAVFAVPGQINFFKGSKSNQKRKHYAELRRKLGKKKLLKKIKSIGSKEQRYMKDVNHKISGNIVKFAKNQKAIIQMEKLTDIRERINYTKKLNKQLHNWNFRQLQIFIEYKANAEGIPVLYIDPRNTSRKCHKCGHIEKNNRPRQNYFHCVKCGFTSNADYNAARNIAETF